MDSKTVDARRIVKSERELEELEEVIRVLGVGEKVKQKAGGLIA